MPHPEQEHALMIEVATLTRQRDDMERIGNAKIAKWQTRAEKAESALAAANARAEKAEQLVCDFQAAAMIDVGNMGGPCAVEPRHVEKHVTELREALAAARRECEGLRAMLLDVKADLGHAEWGTPEHGANLLQRIIAKHHPRLSAALASPAAAPAAETWKAEKPPPCTGCGRDTEPIPDGIRNEARLYGHRWWCPACGQAVCAWWPPAQGAEKRIAELEAAIRWALGEEDHFPPRELEQGQYWWRTELRRRANLAARAAHAKGEGT